MKPLFKDLAIPLLITIVGIGWLLTVKSVLPGVNWIWVLGLGALGITIIGVGGVDKVTMVVGPFLILSTIFSLLRQTGRISIDVEVPSLVIAGGLLMMLVRILPIPNPRWLIEEPLPK